MRYYNPYSDALAQPHLLIAGATGSGKSVLVNGLIYTALFKSPQKVQFILIDPKRVELIQYKRLPCPAARLHMRLYEAIAYIGLAQRVLDRLR